MVYWGLWGTGGSQKMGRKFVDPYVSTPRCDPPRPLPDIRIRLSGYARGPGGSWEVLYGLRADPRGRRPGRGGKGSWGLLGAPGGKGTGGSWGLLGDQKINGSFYLFSAPGKKKAPLGL